MEALFDRVPPMDVALAVALLVAALVSVVAGRRGGRFRELPGWVGFWVVFAAILVGLTHAPRWLSFSLLALMMFASLRAYFFVAPVRPQDRFAVLATYLAVPLTLLLVYTGSHDTFLAAVPVSLFLFIPAFVALGRVKEGMLDSMGRTLLAVVFFVFCTAHLALLVDQPAAVLELFGVFVITAELPQRAIGRFRPGSGWIHPTAGIVFSLLLAVAVGFWLGPRSGLVEEDAARAGFLVGLAVTLGAPVSNGLAQGLAMSTSASTVGRGAFLNRTVPAVYAAPVFFHYLNHFA